jgi:hypothetical protein
MIGCTEDRYVSEIQLYNQPYISHPILLLRPSLLYHIVRMVVTVVSKTNGGSEGGGKITV